MPKFTVYGYTQASLFIEVEAESKEAAKEFAQEQGVPGLCHYCSSKGLGHGEEWSLSDGIGDEVTVTEAFEADSAS